MPWSWSKWLSHVYESPMRHAPELSLQSPDKSSKKTRKRVTRCQQTRRRNKTSQPFNCDRLTLISPLLWKIILNSIKRWEVHFFPPFLFFFSPSFSLRSMFLPLSLWLLIRWLNLLQNNSKGKEIKGCWIKYEPKAVNCSNAYHFIQM